MTCLFAVGLWLEAISAHLEIARPLYVAFFMKKKDVSTQSRPKRTTLINEVNLQDTTRNFAPWSVEMGFRLTNINLR